MEEVIKRKLEDISLKENIKIIYACESGSRAWGFASNDSDYDVRFIYIRPLEDYLAIDDIKDTLEFPINDVLDLSGWDIRKALKLFRNSNPVLFEWLQSPIIYSENLSFRGLLSTYLNEYFSLRAGLHHYLGMTINPLKNDLQEQDVKAKKYCYALRSVLSCKWIREKQTVPPMEFKILRMLISDRPELNKQIDYILERKMNDDEKLLIPRVDMINDFIEAEIKLADEFAQTVDRKQGDTEKLNGIFRTMLSI